MNWDKPMDMKTYQGGHIDEFNKYHGTRFNIWPDVYEMMGIGRGFNFNMKEYAPAYLTYCKLMDSPLGKALS